MAVTDGLSYPLQSDPLRQSGGEINVKSAAFGATGNNGADDTAAIAAAIAACPDYGTVFFPPGTYLTAPISIVRPISLRGCGSQVSSLRALYSFAGHHINLSPGTQVEHVGIGGLTLDVTNAPGAHGLRVANVLHGRLSDIRTLGLPGIGIEMVSGGASVLDSIVVPNPSIAGLQIDGDGGMDHRVNNCHFFRDTAGTTSSGLIYVSRTTSADVGGMFFSNTLLNRTTGVVNGGLVVDCNVAGTVIPVFISQVASDNIDGPPMSFKNCVNVEITNSWCVGVGGAASGALVLDGTANVSVVSSRLWGSPTTPAVRHVNAPAHTSMLGNLLTGSVGHFVSSGSRPVNLSLIANRYTSGVSVTNDTATLALAMGDTGSDLLSMVGTTGTSAPSAGGAIALPLTPSGYLSMYVNGVARQIAYY